MAGIWHEPETRHPEPTDYKRDPDIWGSKGSDESNTEDNLVYEGIENDKYLKEEKAEREKMKEMKKTIDTFYLPEQETILPTYFAKREKSLAPILDQMEATLAQNEALTTDKVYKVSNSELFKVYQTNMIVLEKEKEREAYV
jgi:hypothetical protein